MVGRLLAGTVLPSRILASMPVAVVAPQKLCSIVMEVPWVPEATMP